MRLLATTDIYVPYCAQRCPPSARFAYQKTDTHFVNGSITYWHCVGSCPPSGYSSLIYRNELSSSQPTQCVADCLHYNGSHDCVSACNIADFHDKATNTCYLNSAGCPSNRFFIEPVSLIKYCVITCDNTVKSDNLAQHFIYTDGNQCKTVCPSA
jgi:hypothetical protein